MCTIFTTACSTKSSRSSPLPTPSPTQPVPSPTQPVPSRYTRHYRSLLPFVKHVRDQSPQYKYGPGARTSWRGRRGRCSRSERRRFRSASSVPRTAKWKASVRSELPPPTRSPPGPATPRSHVGIRMCLTCIMAVQRLTRTRSPPGPAGPGSGCRTANVLHVHSWQASHVHVQHYKERT